MGEGNPGPNPRAKSGVQGRSGAPERVGGEGGAHLGGGAGGGARVADLARGGAAIGAKAGGEGSRDPLYPFLSLPRVGCLFVGGGKPCETKERE